MDSSILFFVSTLTSAVAAIAGMGGGMMLIAILPSFLPASAVIPVHGVAQLASNGSRAFIAITHVRWAFLKPFLVGSVLGVLCVSVLVRYVSAQTLLVGMALYILLTLWSTAFSRFIKRAERFSVAGFWQSGLSVVVGATGPLTTTLLTKKCDSKDEIIVTNAVFMAFSHGFKIPLFLWVGFNYATYWLEIVLLSIGAVLGSYVGTWLRQFVSDQHFKLWVKIALTLLAIRIIATSLV
ncbi:sulfite exporter TauE/SafE family protein [Aestuariibacter sp. AA17]|uniref:Probable membrane transporter protein n=1 Tax=Fluctibacter corallii TaxID=2984329 RepID=A0ABT3A7V8_9ALTE|nr:sulfite exporter TauE/SafE family protein [Aestuariibacter sp. AA17]MCV2884683.1 sulfite exporter TauE/SafE family protein [Aestuariibacter sp. AA17]